MSKSGFKSHPSGDHAHVPSSKPISVKVAEPVQPHPSATSADLDQIEAYANDPANATPIDQPSRLEQLQDEADAAHRSGANDFGPNELNDLAAQSGQAASSHRDRADRNASSALREGDQTAKDAQRSLNSAKKTTGINMNRPITPEDAQKFSTPEERAASPMSRGASSKISRAAEKVLGKKNRTGIKIAIVAGVIILGVLGFALTIPFKLMHIASVLFGHNFKTSNHIERRVERKLIRSLFIKQLDDNTGHRSNTGKFLHDKLTNMRMDKFDKILAKDGLKMEFDSKNRFVGIKDATGKLVTDDFREKSYWDARKSMGDLVTDRLAPHRYLQHALYIKAMRLHAGVSFKFWVRNKIADVSLKDRLVSKVRRGLEGDKYIDESGRSPAQDGVKDPKAGVTGAADAAAASEEAEASKSVFEKTKSMVAAHKAGIASFQARSRLAFGVTGIGMLYCTLYEMIKKSIEKGYITRAVFLMREGNMIVTMAHQMYTGQLNLDDFGEMMEHFDGNPNIDTYSDGKDLDKAGLAKDAQAEDGKDFTQACSWKRDTGGGECSTDKDPKNYDHYNPDLSEAANPDAYAMHGVLGVLSAIIGIPGADQVCKVLNSWFGWVVMGAELVVSALSGAGTATIAASVLKGVIVGKIIEFALPKLLDSLTNLAITGTENAVGLTNNGDAGLNLSSKDYGRTNGDRVGTQAETGAILSAARQEEIIAANEKGWTYRTFALDNTNSIASKLIEHTPTSPAGVVAAIRTTLAALPRNFASVFVRPNLAFAADTFTDPYEFRAMVTTDAEIDKYEIDDIENFLTAQVVDESGTATTRLKMLGDPTTYTPANGEDTNKSDLMHCFVSMFRTPYDSEKDDICLDLGILTNRDSKGTIIKNPRNPGQHEIIDKIYCEAAKVCGLPYADDFNKYRLYMKYVFLARALDGLTNDEDPFAATVAAEVSGTYGICVIPALGSDPAAPVPPDSYNRVSVDGQTLNARTKFMYDNAVRYAKQLGYKGGMGLYQGSYSTDVSASAGTHDGGGALDVRVDDLTGSAAQINSQRTIAVKALRMAGFAAWNRRAPTFSPDHIHAIAIGDKEMSSGAAAQVPDYFKHLDGLAGHGPDPDVAAGYPYPLWAGQICKDLGIK